MLLLGWRLLRRKAERDLERSLERERERVRLRLALLVADLRRLAERLRLPSLFLKSRISPSSIPYGKNKSLVRMTILLYEISERFNVKYMQKG